MSGIVGLFYLDGRPVDPVELGKMTDILAHRGPDDADIWYDGSVGLGHRMLWTTPESLQEKLPLTNQSGHLVITADARIDNRDELIPLLGLNDRPAGDVTDSQLILAAYEKWGEQCPEKLLGDFSFAIWDGRKQVLFCARDHFGVRPFVYYHQKQRGFIFASEAKALLSLPHVPHRLNEVMIADYLHLVTGDTAGTFYEGIYRLPPAHSMTVSASGVHLREYWALDLSHEINYQSDSDYAEAFREVFSNAVRCRMRSAHPLGSMLSGGLDSSSITSMARILADSDGGKPIHTFSATVEGDPQCDERRYIDAVLAMQGFEPHFIDAGQLPPLADIENVLWEREEPFYGPNLFIHRAMWDIAQQAGVRVILDGAAGDSVVSHGETFIYEMAYNWRWLRLARELKEYCAIYDKSYPSFLSGLIWNESFKARVPRVLHKAWRSIQGRRTVWHPSHIINPDFARQLGLEDRFRQLDPMSFEVIRSERKAHFAELTSGFLPNFVEAFEKSSTAFSLEVRYPFLDRRVVETSLAMPPEQKMHQGMLRMILRRAMAGVLPDSIRWRLDKGNYGYNLERGLREFERRRLDAVILHNSHIIEKYVNVPVVQKHYKEFNNHKDSGDVNFVLLAAVLSFWLQDHAFSSSPAQHNHLSLRGGGAYEMAVG